MPCETAATRNGKYILYTSVNNTLDDFRRRYQSTPTSRKTIPCHFTCCVATLPISNAISDGLLCAVLYGVLNGAVPARR